MICAHASHDASDPGSGYSMSSGCVPPPSHLHLHEEVVERHRARLEPVLHAFRLLVGEAGVSEAHLLHHLAADRAARALCDITDGAANIL